VLNYNLTRIDLQRACSTNCDKRWVPSTYELTGDHSVDKTYSLERYGFRIVHRASSIAFLALSAPFLYHVKVCIPLSPTSTSHTISLRFLLTPNFWALQTSNIVEGLGFFLPPLYLPTYAITILSLPPQTSSLLLSLLNASSVPGQILLGALSDRVHISTVLLVFAVDTTLSVFLSWGLAAHVPLLAVFEITYGFFAGGFSSTYIGMCREVVKKNPGAELRMVRTFRTNAVDFANAVETEGVWGACRREGCGQCDY